MPTNHPILNPARLTKQGFTLSELLIALGVLGVIGALTIPSVFSSTHNKQDALLFRDTLHQLNEATQTLAQSPPALNAGSSTWDLFNTVLNSKEATFVGVGDSSNSITLQNGVVLSNFEGLVSDGGQAIVVDLNGAGGVNQIGRDRVAVSTCFDPAGQCLASVFVDYLPSNTPSGTVVATPNTGAETIGGAGGGQTNTLFFDQLMHNRG
jgi:prepilin-type N-terminal cleavage/methylation domain-containing protein